MVLTCRNSRGKEKLIQSRTVNNCSMGVFVVGVGVMIVCRCGSRQVWMDEKRPLFTACPRRHCPGNKHEQTADDDNQTFHLQPPKLCLVDSAVSRGGIPITVAAFITSVHWAGKLAVSTDRNGEDTFTLAFSSPSSRILDGFNARCHCHLIQPRVRRAGKEIILSLYVET
jgi:hypothetical protein